MPERFPAQERGIEADLLLPLQSTPDTNIARVVAGWFHNLVSRASTYKAHTCNLKMQFKDTERDGLSVAEDRNRAWDMATFGCYNALVGCYKDLGGLQMEMACDEEIRQTLNIELNLGSFSETQKQSPVLITLLMQ